MSNLEQVTSDIILEMLSSGDEELISLMVEHEENVTGVKVEDKALFVENSIKVMTESKNSQDETVEVMVEANGMEAVLGYVNETTSEDVIEESEEDVIEESEEVENSPLLTEELNKMKSFFG
jgi:flavoprotein